MKHEIENEKLTESHSSKRIRIIEPEKYLTTLIIRRNLKIPNIFLIQNKGKGPPGRTRSPGLVDYLTRANQPAAFPKSHPEFVEGLIEGNNTFNKNELLIHIKPNLYSQLNFTIMKKHLFILILAVFAINVAWGQAIHESSPIPLGSCSDDPLHPIPGRAYTYGVTAPANSTYTWWATKDANFIVTNTPTTTTNMSTDLLTVANGDLLAADANYAPTVPVTASTVSLTWSAQLLAGTSTVTTGGKTPTFVVVKVNDAASCTDNFKVYQLDPRVAFTVDILPMNLDATPTGNYSATISDCFDNVRSATYNAGNIVYDYGTNVLYYEVVAANFTNFFNTQYKLTGLQTGQTADLAWSYGKTTSATYTDFATGVAGTASGTTIDITGTVSATVAATTNTSEGVSIYIRVTIHNGYYEGLIDSPIALAVEGTDSESNADKDNSTCLVPTPNYEDVATQTLTLRPTVTPNSPPSAPDVFVPKLP